MTDHRALLADAMDLFTDLRPVSPDEEDVLAMSVYNEGLALAIRRGAPLSSYSIDRRCMQEYAKHATAASTYAAVCFVCARRFVHVSGTTKNRSIEYRTVVTRELNESLSAECDYLLGCDEKYARKFFSLESDCEAYGKISDSTELSEVSEEFDDWHLNVTLNDATFYF